VSTPAPPGAETPRRERPRGDGQARRRATADARQGLHQVAPAQPVYPYAHLDILSPEQLERIHEASLDILKEMGMRLMLPEARAIFRRAGALVDDETQMVRADRSIIEAAMATVPSSFTLHGTNPARSVVLGGRHMAFSNVGGPPNVTDIDRGKRPGNLEDFKNLLKIAQSLNVVHMLAGYAPEPTDVEVPVRHLEATYWMLKYVDKPLFMFTLSPQRTEDVFQMLRIARGQDEDAFKARTQIYTVVNTNSPLQLDRPMLGGIIDLARAGQMVCVTPFTLAGAMAPVTLAGALALQNAEALMGMTLSQLVRPGAPLVYGGFTSNVDMRTGAPAFGTPEYVKAALIGGQLARRYNVPYRSSNTNASNWPDVQSAYEGAMSIWGALLGGVNLLLHGVGWLEGGLCASYEKYIIDAEMLQTMVEFLRPEAVDDGTLALDAIREVGPGGHFFGAAHTLARYEKAFYTPLLSDWRTYEQWRADGAVDATHRANRIWKQMLAEYQEPPMDPAVDEELRAFVERRRREGGAPIN